VPALWCEGMSVGSHCAPWLTVRWEVIFEPYEGDCGAGEESSGGSGGW
jgi:hypothetical protein